MGSRTVDVTNPLGLHARAAARFVHAASDFEADITVAHGNRTVDGKSIMGLLRLAAPQGARLAIQASGSDAEAALERLSGLVTSGFSEDGWNG